jgi:hypothetical protein
MEEEDDKEDATSDSEAPADQLISLILLYNAGTLFCMCRVLPATSPAAIPRLKLRKKSPSDTLRPLLSQLESTISLAGSHLTRDQGREIISNVSQLSLNALSWAVGLQSEDAPACQVGLFILYQWLNFIGFSGNIDEPS